MTVTLKTEGDVSIIHMDDGKVNVFSPEMIQNFEKIMDQIPTDKGSVLITGRPGMFSAGFDLKVMMSSPENAAAMVKSGFLMLKRVFSFPRPVVLHVVDTLLPSGLFFYAAVITVLAVQATLRLGQMN